jgi:hypothetical protein
MWGFAIAERAQEFADLRFVDNKKCLAHLCMYVENLYALTYNKIFDKHVCTRRAYLKRTSTELDKFQVKSLKDWSHE